ncbi:MAG: hypothetical protein AAFU61_01480 [Pseudomonadota bacterium]
MLLRLRYAYAVFTDDAASPALARFRAETGAARRQRNVVIARASRTLGLGRVVGQVLDDASFAAEDVVASASAPFLRLNRWLERWFRGASRALNDFVALLVFVAGIWLLLTVLGWLF